MADGDRSGGRRHLFAPTPCLAGVGLRCEERDELVRQTQVQRVLAVRAQAGTAVSRTGARRRPCRCSGRWLRVCWRRWEARRRSSQKVGWGMFLRYGRELVMIDGVSIGCQEWRGLAMVT